jgi:predicted RNA methylase
VTKGQSETIYNIEKIIDNHLKALKYLASRIESSHHLLSEKVEYYIDYIISMRLKHLQSALSSVPTPQFVDPNISLEQYATSPILCSYIIQAAFENDDIDGRSVLDLGCGTGMLSIGSALVGSPHIMMVDCDLDAMRIAMDNVEAMEITDTDSDDCCAVEFILAKVNHVAKKIRGGAEMKGRGGRGKGRGRIQTPSLESDKPIQSPSQITAKDDGIPLLSGCVDTVITNPPFGTKPGNAGIDVTFLRSAIRLARRAVYSFHKTSTRPYLIKLVQSWGYEIEVVAQMKFDIPKMYKFHKENNVDVDVDLIRVIVCSRQDQREE